MDFEVNGVIKFMVKNVKLLVDKMIFLGDGGLVVFGVMVMVVNGYILGYMVYMLEDGG